jgi:HSP20 family protein
MNDQTTEGTQLETSAQDRRTFLPAVDVTETQDALLILADMPGTDENGVEISLEGRTLTVLGRGEAVDYRRQFTVAPERLNADGIRADIKNGVLRVALPKAEAAKPRRIQVRAA